MVRAFNPPPGWPKPEEGWTPPPGWKPDPSWPAPPQGWDFWVEKADDIGSSLFGGSALGSSLFDTSDTVTDSYGSVSPSGEAHIPGAPTGPDFTASSRDPRSASEGVRQSSAGAPASPSAGGPASNHHHSGQYAPTGAGQHSAPGAGPYAGPGGSGGAQDRASAGPSSTSPYAASSTPGRSPNAAPPVGPQGGGRTLLLGLALAIAGVVFTGVSFANAPAGGQFSVYWTPVLFGVILMIMGLVRAARARTQRRQLGGTGAAYNPSGYLTQPGASGDGSGVPQTGHSSTVSMHNPNDPRNYKRR